MARKGGVQAYPRIDNRLLDDSKLVEHQYDIDTYELHEIIKQAILYANKKSSRAILQIPDNATDNQINKIYTKTGSELFDYFIKYCGDPASTAFQCNGRCYKEVAKEQFYNRTLQKERINSGWIYQYIAKDTAIKTQRFSSVSDIGNQEADFCAIIGYKNSTSQLSIYVSVKNRSNTLGGQDWPKAIAALEEVALSDKNRSGEYICIFGIAMEKGQRRIKYRGKTNAAHSINTEIWNSDFFWPFFSNKSYDEIIKIVLQVLIETTEPDSLNFKIPDELIESFGERCRAASLLDENGNFNDPFSLAKLFCGGKR